MVGVSVSQIIAFLGDRVLDARLPDDALVDGQSSLIPGVPNHLTFAGRRTDAVRTGIGQTQSAVVLTFPEFLDLARADTCAVAVQDPRLEFARVVQQFFVTTPDPSVAPTAVLDESAIIGPGAAIAAGVVVGAGCRIGERVRLGANCVIGAGAQIGDDVTIGPGAVIGHNGFGYSRETDGTPVLLPHTGSVRIGDRVEIGANTAIDRGTIDHTVIEDDAKIDNLVHIAHNCHIGRGAFVIATAILCGGVRVGEGAWVAPNAAVRDQLSIGERATVGLSATVVKDVASDTLVVGSPARPVER